MQLFHLFLPTSHDSIFYPLKGVRGQWTNGSTIPIFSPSPFFFLPYRPIMYHVCFSFDYHCMNRFFSLGRVSTEKETCYYAFIFMFLPRLPVWSNVRPYSTVTKQKKLWEEREKLGIVVNVILQSCERRKWHMTISEPCRQIDFYDLNKVVKYSGLTAMAD